MTISNVSKNGRLEVWFVGALVGGLSILVGARYGSMVGSAVVVLYLTKKKLGSGDLVRFAFGWVLGLIVCNILTHLGSFADGFTAGWKAGAW